LKRRKGKGKRVEGPESRVHDDFRLGRDTLESRGQRIEKRKADTTRARATSRIPAGVRCVIFQLMISRRAWPRVRTHGVPGLRTHTPTRTYVHAQDGQDVRRGTTSACSLAN